MGSERLVGNRGQTIGATDVKACGTAGAVTQCMVGGVGLLAHIYQQEEEECRVTMSGQACGYYESKMAGKGLMTALLPSLGGGGGPLWMS